MLYNQSLNGVYCTTRIWSIKDICQRQMKTSNTFYHSIACSDSTADSWPWLALLLDQLSPSYYRQVFDLNTAPMRLDV